MKRLAGILSVIAVLSTFPVPSSLQASEAGEEALATVKKMVGFVRYSEKKPAFADKALESVGVDRLSSYLMGSYASKATEKQDERFQGLIKDYLKLRAFPEALRIIKDIDISYNEPVVQGDTVRIKSSVLYSGSEKIIFTWVLTKSGNEYRLTDFLDEKNVSSMQNSRDKQILPLIKNRGIDGMLDTMENVIKSYR